MLTTPSPERPSRRELIRRTLAAAGVIATGPFVAGCGSGWGRARDVPTVVLPGIGDLQPADADGVRAPAGFRARVVARSGEPPLAGGAYVWHRAPDGGAVFADTAGGGWIYASNSESGGGAGGVGALRFDAAGDLVDAYPLLQGTSYNCAGGPTPWGTWLSCEEWTWGRVHECDPLGALPAVARPALGSFAHEAAAVDPATGQVYLTEDERDGCLYRFTPDRMLPGGGADLGAGLLEVACVEGTDEAGPRPLAWRPLLEPNPESATATIPTRYQVAGCTVFTGGEGIFHHDGAIYFTTKYDNRVWVLDLATSSLSILYDGSVAQPLISQVDNVTVAAGGMVYVAEDGPNQRIVAFAPDGRAGAVIEILGHAGSELTGPAFDPSGTRLYFSSQRGPGAGGRPWGVTFEVEGPFAAL